MIHRQIMQIRIKRKEKNMLLVKILMELLLKLKIILIWQEVKKILTFNLKIVINE